MKKYLSLYIILLLAVYACNNPKIDTQNQAPIVNTDSINNSGINYGEKIDGKNAISMDSLLALVASGKNKIDSVKVEGNIAAVCQAKGCWMDIVRADSSNLHVSFNEEFFIPKNSSGRHAIFMGTAYMDTTSVEALQHFAEDEGKSKAEIAKITSPEIRLAFDAKGVLIR